MDLQPFDMLRRHYIRWYDLARSKRDVLSNHRATRPVDSRTSEAQQSVKAGPEPKHRMALRHRAVSREHVSLLSAPNFFLGVLVAQRCHGKEYKKGPCEIQLCSLYFNGILYINTKLTSMI